MLKGFRRETLRHITPIDQAQLVSRKATQGGWQRADLLARCRKTPQNVSLSYATAACCPEDLQDSLLRPNSSASSGVEVAAVNAPSRVKQVFKQAVLCSESTLLD